MQRLQTRKVLAWKWLTVSHCSKVMANPNYFTEHSAEKNIILVQPKWGTKVLRHFCKMAHFSIVDIRIPFPCLPQPLPPWNQCCILDSQVFLLFQTTLIRGVREFTVFKRNEITHCKWILFKYLIKAPVLNKCVNYFCPWL